MYDVAGTVRLDLNIVRNLSWGLTNKVSDPPASRMNTDIGIFWENFSGDLGEIISDNFLNWVRNSSVGAEGSIDDYDYSDFDFEPRPREQRRARAYWRSGVVFKEAAGESVRVSPGIIRFTEDAVAYVATTNAYALLRSLGTGEPDSDCS